MKVICIDGVKMGYKGIYYGIKADKENEIHEGEVYTVIGENEQKTGWKLLEKPCGFCYLKNRFIPLSEIDELELMEHRHSKLTT